MSVINYHKLHAKIAQLIDLNDIESLKTFDLHDSVSNKILNHQYVHLCSLIDCIKRHRIALDGSDPGTGKTYTAIALCKQLRLCPLIICPKIMISIWLLVCAYFGIKYLEVINYEAIRSGKSVYIKIVDNKYVWSLPKFSIVIFDEVHKCKNLSSNNGKLLASSKPYNNKFYILMLSATIADRSKDFAIYGYMLGFYNKLTGSKSWINMMIRKDKFLLNNKSSIYNEIYPNKGSRMDITELGEDFPKNVVSLDCYKLSEEKLATVNQLFEKINKYDESIKSKEQQSGCILKEITGDRIKLELYKIPLILKIMEEYINKNYNIAIFVNFRETQKALQLKLKTNCVIHGDLDNNIINKNIEDFQNNTSKIMICTIPSITLGISLHDLHGVPRMTIIMPVLSAITYEQLLGRTYRVGIQTPTIQKIIFFADTCEQVLCNQLKNKLTFIHKCNKEII